MFSHVQIVFSSCRFTVFFFCIIALLQCSNNDNNTLINSNPNQPETISCSQILYPGEIASVKSTRLFSNDTIKANLDDSIEVAVYADSQTIYFALPVTIAAGNHIIRFGDPQISIINIQSLAALAISDPHNYLDTLISNRIADVRSFSTEIISNVDVDSMVAYCNYLQAYVLGLDSSQQKQLSIFFAANATLFGQINQSLEKLTV